MAVISRLTNQVGLASSCGTLTSALLSKVRMPQKINPTNILLMCPNLDCFYNSAILQESSLLSPETNHYESHRAQMVEMQTNLNSQYQSITTYNEKIDYLLQEIRAEK